MKLDKWAPWIFVLIWSQGFLVAKYAFFNSDVIFFLAVRMTLASVILFLIAKVLKVSLKLSRSEVKVSLAIGIALHVIYLGGVWQAEAQGASAGIAAVITSLQPLLVSMIAIKVLGEGLSRLQVVGLLLGFGGVLLVVSRSFNESGQISIVSLCLLILALLGSTSATLLQKKMGVTVPLIAGTFYQFLIAAIVLLATSIFTGQHRLDWNVESTLAMAYAVLVTSVIAILILLWMLTHGSAAKVSSLLYLVPPMTAVQAWFLFNEKLNAQGVTGIAATALGVALVQRQRA